MNLEDCITQVEDFLNDTQDARYLSERDRDYKDNKQWTDEEKAKLIARNQAPIVVNRVNPKVEGLKGLLISRNTDPKAFPRTPAHEEAAEAITDSLRFVSDNTSFDQIKLDVFDNVIVEGYGAALIDTVRTKKGMEVSVSQIPWDRFYYDPHSREIDFSDAGYMGVVIWMREDQIKDTFGVEVSYDNYQTEEYGETFDDRPRWSSIKDRRIRVCQHFFFEKNVWKMCYFTWDRFLIKPIESPYLDEDGIPECPIEAISAHIDRDNNRFGEVRYWIDLQDEINHRRSKFLHLLSVRQTAGRKGAIDDVKALKRELAKPDGHVEYQGEKGDFEVLQTGDMAQAQLGLYQDTKSEIDAVGFNAQLSGERQGDLSGKAIANLQNASLNEVSGIFNNITSWEKRCYRKMWHRVRQFWGEEKWIRVLDDQSKLRWVGLNQKVTLQQALEEKINDESLNISIRQQASQLYQPMMQNQDPRLNQIIEVRNNIAEVEVDIMIDVTDNNINIQNEQFEILATMAQTRPEVPFKELVRMSNLRTKDKENIIKSIEAGEQAMSDRAAQSDQISAEEALSKADEKKASADKKRQEAIQTNLQTQLMLETPPENTGVVI